MVLLYYVFIFFIAEIFIFIYYLAFFYLGIKKIKNKDFLSLGILGTLFAFLVSEVTKSLLPISRPQNPLLGYREGSSFPSTHSSISFALATAVFIINKRLGYLFYIGATVIALGRFLGGVHTFWDVLAGAGVGIFCTYLIHKFSVHLIFGKRTND